MKIGIDLDDTVIDHSFNLQKLAVKFGFGGITFRDFRRGALKTAMLKEAYHALKEELYNEFSLKAPPTDGSILAIEQLLTENDVFIVSRRSKLTRHLAKIWINKYIPAFKNENVYFVNSDNEKGGQCKDLGLRVFLDNKEEVLLHIPERTTLPILFDPLHVYESPRFRKVTDWNEFHHLCNQLKNS